MFALIEQPSHGWDDSGRFGAATLFLPMFLQQVAGYIALEAGLSLLPLTVIMFLLSRRWGTLAGRFGPRLFMTVGPLIAGAGLVLFTRLDASAHYVTEVLPAALIFALGLSMTVAPLTAAVLASVNEHRAGVASGVNNAIARVAGLLAIGAVGAVVSAQFISTVDTRLARVSLSAPARAAVAGAKHRPLSASSRDQLPPGAGAQVATAIEDASVAAFRVGMLCAGGLVLGGGLMAFATVRNPRRPVVASAGLEPLDTLVLARDRRARPAHNAPAHARSRSM